MDKYIVEIEGKNTCTYPDGEKCLAFHVESDSGKAVICTKIPLTPYTEPDMGQVRKEAYQQGLFDAKEGKATCQYCEYQYLDDTEEPCKKCRNAYMNKYKPKAKEEQITKGDIVLIKSTPEVEILVTYADEEYVSGIALTEVDGNCEIGDQYTNIRISNVEKTGKHYDIVSVLRKMRENNG